MGDLYNETARAELERHAVAPEVAHAAGLFHSADGKCFLMAWPDVEGGEHTIPRLLPAYRDWGTCPPGWKPDDYGAPRKVDWPSASPELKPVRKGTGSRVVLAEGYMQCLALASWAPEDVTVYGMNGCWGWSKCDLSWATGLDVIAVFDADLSNKRPVYDAAKALGEALTNEGASAVRFLRPPGRGSDGIDDVLARRASETRAPYLARLLDNATDKIGKAPAKKAEVRVDAVSAEIMRAQPVALTAENRVAVYQRGAFRRDPAALNAVAVAVLGEAYWKPLVATIEGFIAGKLYADGVRLPDRAHEPMVNLANGMLDLRTGELYDHDPRWLSGEQLPVSWEPDATAPHYEAWLAAQVGEQADDLEEALATMLDPSATPSRAAFLYGPARSGKSTMVRIAEAIAGAENTSAVTLAQLAETRFHAANVYGKVLNAAAEVRAGHIEDLDIFKKMTGDDPIEGERKNVQPFTFRNRALFVFAANELPTVGESSRAYSERIKPFLFGRSFAGNEDPTVEAAIMGELPGILARWVRAWQRLKARGRYLDTVPGVRQDFERKSDRVRRFIDLTATVHRTAPDGSPVIPGATLPAEQVTQGREVALLFNVWAGVVTGAQLGQNKVLDRLAYVPGVVRVRDAAGRRGWNVTVKPRPEWAEDDPDVGDVPALPALSTPSRAIAGPTPPATHTAIGGDGAKVPGVPEVPAPAPEPEPVPAATPVALPQASTSPGGGDPAPVGDTTKANGSHPQSPPGWCSRHSATSQAARRVAEVNGLDCTCPPDVDTQSSRKDDRD